MGELIEGGPPAVSPIPESQLFEAAKRALSERGFKFSERPDLTYLIAPFAGDLVTYDVSVLCGNGYITVVGELPFILTAETAARVLPDLNALSVTFPIGAYQVASRLLKVQFKVGIPAFGATPADDVIAYAFHHASQRISEIAPKAMEWAMTRKVSEAGSPAPPSAF